MATFGNISEVGKSASVSIQHTIIGGKFTPITGGALDSVSAYLIESTTNNSRNVKAMVYTTAGVLVAESSAITAVTTTAAWHTFTLSGSITASTEYVLVVWADGGAGSLFVHSVGAGADISVEEGLNYSASAPDPIAGGWDSTSNLDIAIYATYTESGTAATITAVSSSRGSDIATASETLTITVDDSTGITSVTVNGEVCSSVATPTGTSVTCICPLGFAAAYGLSGDVVVDNGTASTGYSVTMMQPGGMTETDFTVAYAGLDTNSPFSGEATYSALVIGDSCIYDAVSAEDSIALSMDGLGAFTYTGSFTENQTYSFYIFDASDNTVGTISTLTLLPTGEVIIGDLLIGTANIAVQIAISL